MSLSVFLDALFEHGQVQVGPLAAALSTEDAQSAAELLTAVERDVRAEFPGDAPPFHVAIALWGAERFYRAAQLTVYREAGPELVVAALSDEPPRATAAEQHYAIDLVWRFLPDLVRLAKAVSPNDPLVEALAEFGRRWPLSSVGLSSLLTRPPIVVGEPPDGRAPPVKPPIRSEISPAALAALTEHPGLLQLYVDRIIARKDKSRMDDPRVEAAVRQSAWMHVQLAGVLEDISRRPAPTPVKVE